MEILLASSLDKIFYDAKPNLLDAPELNVIAKNGMFSFQAALRPGGENFPPFGDYAAEVRTELNAKIRVRQVLNVPSRLPVYGWADDFCLRNEIGFYPDALEDKDVFRLVGGRWNSLWIDVTPANKVFEAGEYKIEIVIKDADGSEAARAETKLAVVDAAVPRAPFKHTEWFHTDCLANYYGVSVFSKRYWEITGNFMKSAAGLGVNMILTPVVTPPLDTIQGGERTTVQLADIFFENGKYRFGFDMLSRWIDIAKDAGIEYFEICHLFTQWGALHAPKILVSTDGGAPEQKFGWETAADGDEYVGFLRQFIPALRDFLDKKGVLKNSYFHISDEPGPEQFGQYKKLHSIMKPLLAGCKIFDALSDPAFYSEGLVEIPVVATDHYEGFEALGVKEKWVYYCCGQSNLVSNRFIALPSARSRILGVQLYLYEISGFLQWGFNFYNSGLSRRPIDPYQVTDADLFFPSGDPFIVYPGPDGNAVESIRYMVFNEAFSDYDALCRLEAKAGRKRVVEMIHEGLDYEITFKKYPREADYLLGLKKKVLREIAQL